MKHKQLSHYRFFDNKVKINTVTRDFRNPQKYIVPYEKDKYLYILSKKD